VSDQQIDFYVRILGGKVIKPDNPCCTRSANTLKSPSTGSTTAVNTFSFLSKGRLKMNDQQKKEPYSRVRDQEIRAALDQHWAASDANDFETEHRIYHEDAVLEYPQSGERTRGRRNIQNQRASQPSKKRFAVRRIIGGGDLWVTEFILTYDGKPSYTVSIMEFRDNKVARETQYFADPFVAPASRAQWVERMDT
jgi:SnoaL-like domain